MTDSVQPTTVYWLRHGEPAISHRGFLGRSNPRLTEKGVAQVTHSVGNLNPDVVISSPLLRCQEFAKSFAQSKNRPLEIIKDLQEIDFGQWEGLSAAEISEKFPNEFKKWINEESDAVPVGGESLAGFTARIGSFLQRLQSAEFAGKIVLVVTHGGVLRAVLKEFSGISFQTARGIQLGHGVVLQYSLLSGHPPFLMNIRNPEVEL